MNELFLQELNAITNYANSSNTDNTEKIVRQMLEKLLLSRNDELYGNRKCLFETCEAEDKSE